MPPDIDLRNDGADYFAGRGRGGEEGVSRLCDLAGRAAPFDDEQDLVGEFCEHPRLRDDKQRRAVDDNAVITAAKRVDETGQRVSRVWQQRLDPTSAYRKVIDTQARDVLDGFGSETAEWGERPTVCGLCGDLAYARGTATVEIQQEHAPAKFHRLDSDACRERGLAFAGQARADRQDLTVGPVQGQVQPHGERAQRFGIRRQGMVEEMLVRRGA